MPILRCRRTHEDHDDRWHARSEPWLGWLAFSSAPAVSAPTIRPQSHRTRLRLR